MPVELHYTPRVNGSTYSNVREFLAQKVAPENQPLSLKISCKKLPDLQTLLQTIKHKKVVALDLSFSNMGDTEICLVAEALKTHQTMKKLNLSHNKTGDEGAIALSKLMRANPHLEINLNHNRIGLRGASAFTEAAIATQKTKIELTHNKLGNEGAYAVGQILRRNAGAIKAIFLKHNRIGSKGDRDLAETVPSSISVYHRIRKVPFMDAHPCLAIALMILLPIPFLFLMPCLKVEKDVEGCGHRF